MVRRIVCVYQVSLEKQGLSLSYFEEEEERYMECRNVTF